MARNSLSSQQLAFLAVLASALLCTVAAGPPKIIGQQGGLKVSVKTLEPEELPPASNPYEGKAYAGCDGGFCPAEDPTIERKFFLAAQKGDAKAVRKLLNHDAMNISRNIVPDSEGLARVVDVAVWAASFKGHLDVMKVLLGAPGVKKMYEYEDGHIVDLAAAEGHTKMVKLLLAEKMPVGPSAMAHAAHYNHSDIMSALLTKPMDVKAAMQAISGGGSPGMAKIMLQAIEMAEKGEEKRPNAHDWKGEYVLIAVTSNNLEVLKLLLKDYSIPWQSAQGLIAAAAEGGNKAIFELLLSQKVFKDDKDELEEAVGTGLKVASERGQDVVIDVLVDKHPKLVKQHCKAAIFRALKYGNTGVADILQPLCKIQKGEKLQEAEWLGKLAIAAKAGDAEAVKELMTNSNAAKLIKKLQTQQTDPKTGKKGPLKPPHPSQDPLVIAAKAGHLEVVKLLADQKALCAPCAAGQAARGGHTEIVKFLAEGPGKEMMRNDGSTIDNALRVIAYSMEEGNWDLVAWMVNQHKSRELGPYFLSAIAQEGKIKDLNAMLDILREAEITKTLYFKQQVHSAKITAALAGHVDVLLKLDEYAEPLTPEELAADEARKPKKQQQEDGFDLLEDFKQKSEL